MYVMKARCAFRRRAASWAKEVKVVFGLDGGLAAVECVSEKELPSTTGVAAPEKSAIDAT